MTVDRSGGPGDGAIYGIWRRFSFADQEADIFTRSTNGGRNFRIPVVPPLVPGLGTVAVGPDSEVYLAGIDMTTRTDVDTIAVVRSDDAYRDRPPGSKCRVVPGGTGRPRTHYSPSMRSCGSDVLDPEGRRSRSSDGLRDEDG